MGPVILVHKSSLVGGVCVCVCVCVVSGVWGSNVVG